MCAIWTYLLRVFSILIICGVSCVLPAHAQSAKTAADKPTDNMEKLIQELGLNPATASAEDMDRAGDLLRSKGFKGILLIAPPKVNLDSASQLPLVGFDAYRSSDRIGVSLKYNAVLVATHLESGETVADSLHEVHPEARPPKRAAGTAIADVMGRFTASARERIPKLPWKPGTLSLVVLLSDKRSNQARVALLSDKSPVNGGASGSRLAPVFPAVSDGRAVGATAYANYKAESGSPALPAEAGIAISARREFTYKAGEKCLLHGSFRLPVLPSQGVPRDPNGKALAEVGDKSATAVVPISLVVVGDQMVGAIVFPLKVPTYDSIDLSPDATVATGHFNIDLFAMKEMPKTPQTYTIWAFSGNTIGGPVSVNFVSE